ncbi:lipopolysaccharide biosynthesis protein [Aeromonas salmonicida]|uniref:lipopolysaccharide biosynthesis protein n=1 Tax=Aeromonas salmonicida TaxID=645 RepID=UPI003CFF85A3
MTNSNNNRRIVKNTLFLYFRMLLTLSVTLYTSRVVLNNLGVEDFGIYNVVGGVVTMMAFLSGAMSSATQRFLAFELGKNNLEQLAKVFKMSLNIYWLIVLIVIIVAQTLGLWFVNTQLVIPPDRLVAANWVFQCTLFSFCCTVLGVPYNAAIIAHEKMSAFAYISIIDVLLKLTVIFLLVAYDGDKLQRYSLLLAVVSLLILGCYYAYARWQFAVTRFSWYWNAELFNTLFSYTGWNLFGNVASVATNQGINILLNLFFGTTVNAARAIAFQVNGAVTGFVTSLQMSINPQIVKSYANDNYVYMHQLIMGGSKYTFFLLYALALPILLQTETVLTLWLVNPPEHAELFCQLILVDALITSLSGSLMASVQATGKIKRYQVIVGGTLFFNLPLSYFLLSNGGSAHTVFYVSIATSITALLFRFVLLKELINLKVTQFFSKVIGRSLVVVLTTFFPLSLITFSTGNLVIDFILMSALIVIFTIMAMFMLGLEKFERDFIRARIHKFF